MSDIIRVLRVLEYVGERSEVENTIKRSIKGTQIINTKLTINAATIGDFAEVLKTKEEEPNGK